MSYREIITYIRVTDAEGVIVDNENIALPKIKHPVIYYTEKPFLKIRPLKSDGSPYAKSELSTYDSWEFAIDNDWDRTTTPVVHHSSATIAFNVTEITANGTTYAEISVRINGNTTKLRDAFDTNQQKIDSGIWAELSALNSGEDSPAFIVQFPFVLINKLTDVNESDPSEPTDNYPTWTQADATYSKKTIETQITLTDGTTQNIACADTANTRSVMIHGYIEQNLMWSEISFLIEHDDSNSFLVPIQNLNPISGITHDTDINNGSVRWNITNSSGSDATLVYGIIRKRKVTA